MIIPITIRAKKPEIPIETPPEFKLQQTPNLEKLETNTTFIDATGKIVKQASNRKTSDKSPRPVSSKAPLGNGHWEFDGELGGIQYTGFVYAIFDPFTQKGYIGKKSFRSNGVKNKGKESNWRKYISSSTSLVEAIKQKGIENFRFIVLDQYKARGALTYAETWTQCYVETPTSNKWYNTRIEEISWNVHEPITEKHKERLKFVIELMDKQGSLI